MSNYYKLYFYVYEKILISLLGAHDRSPSQFLGFQQFEQVLNVIGPEHIDQKVNEDDFSTETQLTLLFAL